MANILLPKSVDLLHTRNFTHETNPDSFPASAFELAVSGMLEGR